MKDFPQQYFGASMAWAFTCSSGATLEQRSGTRAPILEAGEGAGKEKQEQELGGGQEGSCSLLQAPTDVMALRVLVVLDPSTRKHGRTEPSFPDCCEQDSSTGALMQVTH